MEKVKKLVGWHLSRTHYQCSYEGNGYVTGEECREVCWKRDIMARRRCGGVDPGDISMWLQYNFKNDTKGASVLM